MQSNRLFSPLILVLLALLALAAGPGSRAQETPPVKARYTKHEYQIAMRDGVKLFTSVYVPKDASQKYPILMQRTPYSVAPYGPDDYRDSLGPSPRFMEEGFIFVYQDVRGRNMSEGEFAWMRPHKPKKSSPTETDETTDTWDTIEWLVKNIPNNNGRVGMWGISYPGHYSAQSLIDPHPALKAVSPQAPMDDNWLGDDMHHNGAFFLEFGSLANANPKYFKGEIKLWNEWMEHGDYDEYWQPQRVSQHLKKVTPAVMTVGGWFDAEDVQGPLSIYRAIEKNNPKAWNVLVEGPWCHGCWARRDGTSLGGVNFGSITSAFYQEKIEFPFFMYFLKDKGEMNLPEAYVFESGSNVWKKYESWPPKGVESKSLYLHSNGKLSFDPPEALANGAGSVYDEYVSDPNKPAPFQNRISAGMSYEYMTDDQRFSAALPDVLVYQTDLLAEDVTIAGELFADLYASTSGTDSDFIVKLIDVFPERKTDPMDGYQMLVRGEPMRAKYRKSWSKPEPMKPNEVTHIPFAMPDVNHTFQKGHRIMIHIQSAWFPLVDRNPQKFMNIYQAKDGDFQKAAQRIYHSAKFPTHLKISVLKP